MVLSQKYPWFCSLLGNGPLALPKSQCTHYQGSEAWLQLLWAKVPQSSWQQQKVEYLVAAGGKEELRKSPGVWPIHGTILVPWHLSTPYTPHMDMGKGCRDSLVPTAMTKGTVRGLWDQQPDQHSSFPPSLSLPTIHPSMHACMHPCIYPSNHPPPIHPTLPPSIPDPPISLCHCRRVKEGSELAPRQEGTFGYYKVATTPCWGFEACKGSCAPLCCPCIGDSVWPGHG